MTSWVDVIAVIFPLICRLRHQSARRRKKSTIWLRQLSTRAPVKTDREAPFSHIALAVVRPPWLSGSPRVDASSHPIGPRSSPLCGSHSIRSPSSTPRSSSCPRTSFLASRLLVIFLHLKDIFNIIPRPPPPTPSPSNVLSVYNQKRFLQNSGEKKSRKMSN